MSISLELRNKIRDYENQGYTPQQIISGLETSENYPDIAQKVKEYRAKGYQPIQILRGFHEAEVEQLKREGSLGQFQRIADIYEQEEREGRETVGKFFEKPTGKTGLAALGGGLQWVASPLTAVTRGAFGEPFEQLAERLGVPEEVDVPLVSKAFGPMPATKLIGETAEAGAYMLPYGQAVRTAIKAPRQVTRIIGKEARPAVEQLSRIGQKPPLKYVTEPIPELAGELSATGKLSKPVIEETLQKKVADAARVTIETLPPNEKKRIGQQVIDLVHSEQINWKELPDILKKYNITAEEFAQRLKDTYSTAGRTLGRLSIVAKNVRKELSKNPEAQKFLDAFIKELPEPSSFDKFMGVVHRLESNRRALLVTQVATSMRNIVSQGARATIGSLDEAFQGAIRATVGGEGNALKQIGEGLDTFTAFYHRFTPSGRKIIERILESDSFTLLKSKMFTAPVQEAIGGKITTVLNTLNRGQEYFFRRLAFESKLTQLLERTGQNIKAIDPNKIPTRMLEEAVDYSLEMTFAAMPKSQFGKNFVRAWSNQPLATALLNPFPRFAFGNALPYLWNFSPISLLKAMNPKVVAELAMGNPDRFAQNASKATLGIMQLGTAIWLRNSEHRAEEWYKVKVADTYYDTRAYAPLLSPYLLVAEAMSHPDRIKPADWAQAFMGLNRISGTGLVLVDVLRQGGIENTAQTISKLAGAYLGSFSVPAKTFQDIYAEFKPEAQIIRDVREQPISGPFMRNIPVISERLPESVSPLKVEAPKTEAPLFRQLTGISKRTKTLVEKEVDELQVEYGTVYPTTGIPKADRLLASYMGPAMEKFASKVIGHPKYAELEPTVKKLIMKQLFIEVKKAARVKLAATHPNLYWKIRWEGIDRNIRDVLEERGIGVR